LINADREYAGTIDFTDTSVKARLVKGQSTSVQTPNGVINFHTHPISAYRGEKTIWGWPSGEDVRELIKFAMSGNRAHIVFGVEGMYVMQVSPCKIEKFRTLYQNNPKEVSILIYFIEEYFKATHALRCKREIDKLKTKGYLITPFSYVDYINTFQLENLNLEKNIQSSEAVTKRDPYGNFYSLLPNTGFLNISKKGFTNKTFKSQFGSNYKVDIHMINNLGAETGQVQKFTRKELESVKDFLNQTFGANNCTKRWNNEPNLWFHVNFFPSDYYLNKLNFNNLIIPENNIRIFYNTNPFIKIFSNKKDGCNIMSLNKKFLNFGVSISQHFGKKVFNSSSSVQPSSSEQKRRKQLTPFRPSSKQKLQKRRVPSSQRKPFQPSSQQKRQVLSSSQLLKMIRDIKHL
jgi:hypothetical protein